MGKNTCKKVAKVMDRGVSLYALGVAIVLVVYMLSAFLYGTWNFLAQFGEILPVVAGRVAETSRGLDQHAIETNILHFIAFTIVMIKAYRILISYAQSQHINIKYLVEISIIAAAIEILFNSHAYHLEVLILFGVFGIANLIVYVWKFDEFKKIAKDATHKEV